MILRVENVGDIILIMCSCLKKNLFALFVNVQYFSVVLYMFNNYTGVQMSFVDRWLSLWPANVFLSKIGIRIKCNL